jgi:hypothetical protein
MFTLAKWYFDLVTEDGAVVIGYSARLDAGPVRAAYSSVLLSAAGGAATEASAFGECEAPSEEDSLVTWRHAALDVRGQWQRLAPPITRRLLQTPDGELDWNCVMPRAAAQIDLAGTRHVGVGYVEHLTLSLPPWKLPFNILHWGRHASPDCSIVWIAWRGKDERCFIWHDGRPQADAVLCHDGISGLSSGATLRIGEHRDVCARPAVARLIDGLPDAVRPIVRPVAAMFEHKMVAVSSVVAPGGSADSGWSVFEEVRW